MAMLINSGNETLYMLEIKRTSAEGKVLEILMEKHPIDFALLLKETGFRRDSLELVMKKLSSKKIIQIECYPERYITLLRKDIEFTGTRRQHKTLKMDWNSAKARLFEGRGYG